MINVLYLDDEAHNLTAFRAAFRRDFQVHVTTEPTDAVRILKEHPIEVIISDQKMPKLSGVEFFELIAPDYPCLLYTSPSPRDRSLSRMPSSA